MRFHVQFLRDKTTTNNPALGDDDDPENGTPPLAKADNVLSARLASSWGQSINRVAVAYTPPSGSHDLDAKMYLWDGLTRAWYELAGSASGKVLAGKITFFDLPCVSDRIIQTTIDGQSNFASGFDVMLVVATDGSAPDGTHTFAMAAIAGQPGL